MYANVQGLAGMFVILDRGEDDHLYTPASREDRRGYYQATRHGISKQECIRSVLAGYFLGVLRRRALRSDEKGLVAAEELHHPLTKNRLNIHDSDAHTSPIG